MIKVNLTLIAIIFSTIIISCGGSEEPTTTYGYSIVDTNGSVVGFSNDILFSVPLIQDLNGNWIRLDLGSGIIHKYPDPQNTVMGFGYENNDCTGAVYEVVFLGMPFLNQILETIPAMYGTNSTLPTNKDLASSRTYVVSGFALGTELVGSFLTVDTTYSATNPYDPFDPDTWLARCIDLSLLPVTPGHCEDSTNQTVVCNETAESLISALNSGPSCQSYCAGITPAGTWVPATDLTQLPLSDQVYSTNWAVLTEVTGEETPVIVTDYSTVAPLTYSVTE